ncbi:hypothetical protein HPP92_006866 [Vanilla planifolia]|uniref:Uncharacterized protein n=1 Tax=Vanilla planifolia TaxID=51239 RepID=A0A835RG06_VANPL|nr:hypothetical protein HPP92_007105 [Vanilla planifolia]KAG0490003.1 hypothetical protein HPP92_006866 [Vanilla planifolia]
MRRIVDSRNHRDIAIASDSAVAHKATFHILLHFTGGGATFGRFIAIRGKCMGLPDSVGAQANHSVKPPHGWGVIRRQIQASAKIDCRKMLGQDIKAGEHGRYKATFAESAT